jgi:dTDP-4-amino-4,6-dideoxygalactose transaminase
VPVPLFANSLRRHQPRIAEKLAAVAASGTYILGPEVEAFEAEFARYLGVKHCVGVANGTDALAIALRTLGVGRDDEVIVPAFTFYATSEAVAAIGARPVFCDVDPATFCLTADSARAAMTAATKAIVAVHLFGQVAPVAELRELGVPVLEDAAQAAGAAVKGVKAGALGDAATFSFFPSKNLPCLGDGGAITTHDDALAAHARRLRFHGSKDKRTFVEVGYNSRLDEIQAAVLRLLLPELDGWNAGRAAAAACYETAGIARHVRPPVVADGVQHAYHLYVARHDDADGLAGRLAERGIQARGYYRLPLHRQPAMAAFAPAGELPGAEEAARTNVALPMGSELSEQQVREVVAACASGST